MITFQAFNQSHLPTPATGHMQNVPNTSGGKPDLIQEDSKNADYTCILQIMSWSFPSIFR
jgi:hypothetical protein